MLLRCQKWYLEHSREVQLRVFFRPRHTLTGCKMVVVCAMRSRQSDTVSNDSKLSLASPWNLGRLPSWMMRILRSPLIAPSCWCCFCHPVWRSGRLASDMGKGLNDMIPCASFPFAMLKKNTCLHSCYAQSQAPIDAQHASLRNSVHTSRSIYRWLNVVELMFYWTAHGCTWQLLQYADSALSDWIL